VSTTLSVVGLAVGVMAALLVCSRHILASVATGDLRGRLDALQRQVTAWQAAHDHQVASLDRRMRDVEVAAARAEEEARIVSVQMAELTQGLVRRLEQVEQRPQIAP
jgi:hypothetical protein